MFTVYEVGVLLDYNSMWKVCSQNNLQDGISAAQENREREEMGTDRWDAIWAKSLNLSIWLLVLTPGFSPELIPLKPRQPVEEMLFFSKNPLKNMCDTFIITTGWGYRAKVRREEKLKLNTQWWMNGMSHYIDLEKRSSLYNEKHKADNRANSLFLCIPSSKKQLAS